MAIPWRSKIPDTGNVTADNTWRKAELFGNTLGQLVERAVKGGEEARVDFIAIRGTTIFSPMHNDRFRAASAAGVFGGRKQLYTNGQLDPSIAEKEVAGLGKIKLATGRGVRTEVSYIRLIQGVRVMAEIVTVPGRDLS